MKLKVNGILALGAVGVLWTLTQCAVAADADSASILGFAPRDAAREHEIEAQFQALPSAERLRGWHREFTTQPHPAASAENTRLAGVIRREWLSQGWDEVRLRHYDVLHSSPRHVSLEMTAPVRYRANLHEAPDPADPATRNPAIDGAYFGYSASGDISAELVYAHSGNPEDYAVLRRHGISVKGKVVLVRYSNPYSYRGFKALTAEREGAAAILIYSDPAEDGYARGAVFPKGPFGPDSHIQHGAITYDYIVPGDPTTPGWASVPGAKHIRPEDAQSLPKIVGLPLSWRDAKPLLEHMNGEPVPAEWRGALPITYRFSGGVTVHLNVDMDTRFKRYTVVEARIRGSELPDEWVLIGNHRDAWVYGGVDPVSGTASMLELTRSLGELKRRGMRPRRTLIACSWDGEEYALTGSTEWGEQFAAELEHKLVAYLNVDEAVAGAATTSGPDGLSFSPSAVASLAPMLIEAARSVPAPSGKSLYEAWHATAMRDRRSAAPIADSDLVETRIGSGSDHTVFLNHLGRPVVNLGFEGDYGVYHSAYDDHYWMTHVGDPDFAYHVALTRIWGLVALRLANADVLPFDFAANGAALQNFLSELERGGRWDGSRLSLTPVASRIADFERAGKALADLSLTALASGDPSAADAPRIRALNGRLMQVESNWLDPAGIPGRPWFRHLLYAARYTYAHLEFPGLTEAIESGNWAEAERQAGALEAVLDKNTRLLQSAAESWRSAPR